MSDQNWRTDVTAGDYFLHQKKQSEIERRRPTIRAASDLVGPGIGANAVRLDDFNDLLATFNGYYSSAAGAAHAPTSAEAFVGHVVSDATLGGRQEFTGLTTGVEYTRTFTRSPIDPEALAWGDWTERRRVLSTTWTVGDNDTDVLPGNDAVLEAPSLSSVGEPGVYERSDTAIAIRKPGIYTGSVQVGDRVGSTIATISFYQPQGEFTEPSTHLTVPLAQTFYIPFTVAALDGNQAFYVAVQHSASDTRALWWRFNCTRVGDAV